MATRSWRPEGSHVRPTWFPDGRRLFFASQRLDTTDFWTVDLESSALTRVLEARGRAVDATLTADGRAVYYVRMGEHFDLWTAAARRQRHGRPANHNWRCRQANSTCVTWRCTHAARNWPMSACPPVAGLRSLPLRRDGMPAGPSIRIAADAVRRARRPSFSPDAKMVAFERQVSGDRPGLWLLDLAHGSVRALTLGTGDARDPTWSRDGRRRVLRKRRERHPRAAAMRMPDGGTETIARLSDGQHTLLRPRVSPDGTRLAYTRSSEGQLEVWVRVLADGTDKRVARLGEGAAFPVWSPDGRALAIDVWHDGHAQVYVVDEAGSVVTQLSRGVDQAWVRSWSPDGTRVAFAGATDGRWNVWTARRDGTDARRLTDYSDEHHYVRNPEWSPASDRLVYEFATFSGSIWAVPVP